MKNMKKDRKEVIFRQNWKLNVMDHYELILYSDRKWKTFPERLSTTIYLKVVNKQFRNVGKRINMNSRTEQNLSKSWYLNHIK